jgi:hypothetical protein
LRLKTGITQTSYRVLIKQLANQWQKIPFTSIKPNLIKHFINSGFVIGTQNTTELICITNKYNTILLFFVI